MRERGQTLIELSEPLRGLRGASFWRSLDELADTPRFREALAREFPDGASELTDAVSRRQFLRLIGASLALAGVTGCVQEPHQQIVPYVRAPELIVPGQPLFFATAMPLVGYGLGVLAESHMARPTKLEGNPEHPASLGATDHFAQAAILELYAPDRSTVPLRDGRIVPWVSFIGFAQALVREFDDSDGEGFRLLTSGVTSPTLIEQIERLLERWPAAEWHRYDLALRDGSRASSQAVFGEAMDCYYRLDRADVVLSLDADLFSVTPEATRYSHDFAERRRVRAGAAAMNRLYAVGPTPTATGAIADHRLPLRSTEVESFARALAAELGVVGVSPPTEPIAAATQLFMRVVASDLRAHPGRSLVAAGEYQSWPVHALAQAINAALGNLGATVVHIAPLEPRPESELASLVRLAEEMDAGRVEALLMLGGNPVYAAPADLEFARKLLRVRHRMHTSLFVDETSALCTWHLPAAHWLESWSDVRAFDGTASIVQPLIRPLYEGHSAHEVLTAFSTEPARNSYELVRSYWQRRFTGGRAAGVAASPAPPAPVAARSPAATAPTSVASQPPLLGAAARQVDEAFEEFWRTALNRGLVPDTAAPPRPVSLRQEALTSLPAPSPPVSAIEIDFRPDPSIFDGRYANNPWLQELPKPITKITWDNAVLLAPSTAARLSLANEDVVELAYRGRRVHGPVFHGTERGEQYGALEGALLGFIVWGHSARRASRGRHATASSCALKRPIRNSISTGLGRCSNVLREAVMYRV